MKTKENSQDFSAAEEQENNRDGRSLDEEEQDILNLHEQGDTPMISHIGNFDSVSGAGDLELRKGLNLNPPPRDGKCDCCGKPLDQLNPYGGPGDPLVGDFEGALLLKNYRRTGPYDEEVEQAVDEAYDNCPGGDFDEMLKWLIERHGRAEGERYAFDYVAYEQIGASWECRDCKILTEDEYFAKLQERYKSEEDTVTRNDRKTG